MQVACCGLSYSGFSLGAKLRAPKLPNLVQFFSILGYRAWGLGVGAREEGVAAFLILAVFLW